MEWWESVTNATCSNAVNILFNTFLANFEFLPWKMNFLPVNPKNHTFFGDFRLQKSDLPCTHTPKPTHVEINKHGWGLVTKNATRNISRALLRVCINPGCHLRIHWVKVVFLLFTFSNLQFPKYALAREIWSRYAYLLCHKFTFTKKKKVTSRVEINYLYPPPLHCWFSPGTPVSYPT